MPVVPPGSIVGAAPWCRVITDTAEEESKTSGREAGREMAVNRAQRH